MGAVGPSGYPSTVKCLYYVDGSPVISLYARDAARYGEGGPGGLSKVCYRSNGPEVPQKYVGYSTGAKCLSIYDLYGSQVCFTMAPPGMQKAGVQALYSQPAPASGNCDETQLKLFVQNMEEENRTAGAILRSISKNNLCRVYQAENAVDFALEIVLRSSTTCNKSYLLARAVDLLAKLGQMLDAGDGPVPAGDKSFDKLFGAVSQMVQDNPMGAAKSIEGVVYRALGGSSLAGLTYISGIADLMLSCMAKPADTSMTASQATQAAEQIPSETMSAPILTQEPPVQEPLQPDPAPVPAIAVQVPATTDKKMLIVGGILAAVVVGGVAVAFMRKK